MDEDAQPSAESGRQLELLVNVLEQEEAEFYASSQEFEQAAAQQIERLTQGLAPR